ncbi:hypothetical protein ABR776_27255 [Bacillus cereus]|uniref:Uncharacterized protein n=1 Tax=Bacillus cereus TaxID=1396 RepID=A0A1C4DSR3_BACCE|nr:MULTISPECIES: hypothetical protein [Bacillus cereus group]HDR7784943.1 hypothetical protein [Bacillus wiedmannii]MCU5435793.1 hypothetical protein [Bacillus mobilis]OKA27396.1 hypothetical protein BJR06_30255 [Bacillus cereus]OKA30454.1 hypothetical protein BJR07_29740 [Bacillus cereus]SCC34418.1 A0A084J0W1 (Uncharacterized protein) [Bacillus mobilis]
MESITQIIDDLKNRIDDLQSDNEGLKQALLAASSSTEVLSRRVNVLEEGLAAKVDVLHVRQMIKQSEVIKKINESESVGMDCKVFIALDGKVSLESIVKQTTDSIKISANDIKGV